MDINLVIAQSSLVKGFVRSGCFQMAVSKLSDEHAECLPSVAASPTGLSGDCVHERAATMVVVTPPKTQIKNGAIALANA